MKLTKSIFEQLDTNLFPNSVGLSVDSQMTDLLRIRLRKEIYYPLGDRLYTRLYTTLDDAFNDISLL